MSRLFAIESLANAVPGVGGNFTFTVESMQFYVLKGIGPPVVNKSLSLDVKEVRCQSQVLTTNNNHQKLFQVHPRTNALTIAYQSPGASFTDTTLSCSKFVAAAASQQNLNRLWIRYGSKQLPNPIPDIEYAGQKDYIHQRYVESLQYARLDSVIHSPEPFNTWLTRGPYYHFAGYGNSEKASNRVSVSQQFSAAFGAGLAPNVLLFDHFNKKIHINISNSVLSSVKVDGDEYT